MLGHDTRHKTYTPTDEGVTSLRSRFEGAPDPSCVTGDVRRRLRNLSAFLLGRAAPDRLGMKKNGRQRINDIGGPSHFGVLELERSVQLGPAIFGMSRSSVTRRNSRFSRRTSVA